MSGQATGWVLRNGPRDRAMRAVLITIADAANRDGEHAHPGLDAMVDGSLYSEGHVRRTTTKLIADTWLEQTEAPGPGRAAEYRMLDPSTGLGITGLGISVNAAHDARGSEVNAARTPRRRRANAARSDARGSDAPSLLPINDNGNDNGSRANGSTELATADPVKRHAHELTVLAFEQTPKPVTRGGFPAVMGRIEAEVRAGTTIQAIKAAILAGDVTWTADGLRTAISKAKPAKASGARRDGDERSMDELLQVAAAGDKGRTRRR
jgi:hypothetical protein